MTAKKDVVYVVASKLGTIGMGITAYNAIKSFERAGFSYKAFCRGYVTNIFLNKKNLTNYSWLEYLSYPFRAVEKFLKVNINSFKLVNNIFGFLVKSSLPKCKIYHTWMHISPKAILKAKRQGSILILEAANSHPLNDLKIMNEEFSLLNKKGYERDPKKIESFVSKIKLFDYIMCPSDFVYDSFINNGIEKEKLIRMPYGVDVQKFSAKKKKDKKFRVIFVGSIQVRKGIHYLLQAWEELNLKNAELILVGRVWPDISDIVKKYEKNSSINFVGFEKDPNKYLKFAEVFVSPSLEEGSALTTYEAMASGLPLIATYNTGSIARDGKEGFIIPIRDVEAIKEKIKYFYNNPKEVERMGKAARKRVEKFSWENYQERLINKYKEILKKHEKV